MIVINIYLSWAGTLKVLEPALCIHIRKANKINNSTKIVREEIIRAEIVQYSFSLQIQDPLVIIQFIIICTIAEIATFKYCTSNLCCLLHFDGLCITGILSKAGFLLVLHVEPST